MIRDLNVFGLKGLGERERGVTRFARESVHRKATSEWFRIEAGKRSRSSISQSNDVEVAPIFLQLVTLRPLVCALTETRKERDK